MHKTQIKLLNLLDKKDLINKTLREIGSLIGVENSPQKVKHHIRQLGMKGLIKIDKHNNIISKIKPANNTINIPIIGTVGGGEKLSQEALNWLRN